MNLGQADIPQAQLPLVPVAGEKRALPKRSPDGQKEFRQLLGQKNSGRKKAPGADATDKPKADQHQATPSSQASAQSATKGKAKGPPDSQPQTVQKAARNRPLRAWGKSLRKNNHDFASHPTLAYLSGSLSPEQKHLIPDIITESPFIGEALSGSINQLLNRPFRLDKLASMLGLENSLSMAPAELKPDPGQSITPAGFFKSIGIDPSQVLAELSRLKQNLPMNGLSRQLHDGNPASGEPGSFRQPTAPHNIRPYIQPGKITNSSIPERESLPLPGQALAPLSEPRYSAATPDYRAATPQNPEAMPLYQIPVPATDLRDHSAPGKDTLPGVQGSWGTAMQPAQVREATAQKVRQQALTSPTTGLLIKTPEFSATKAEASSLPGSLPAAPDAFQDRLTGASSVTGTSFITPLPQSPEVTEVAQESTGRPGRLPAAVTAPDRNHKGFFAAIPDDVFAEEPAEQISATGQPVSMATKFGLNNASNTGKDWPVLAGATGDKVPGHTPDQQWLISSVQPDTTSSLQTEAPDAAENSFPRPTNPEFLNPDEDRFRFITTPEIKNRTGLQQAQKYHPQPALLQKAARLPATTLTEEDNTKVKNAKAAPSVRGSVKIHEPSWDNSGNHQQASPAVSFVEETATPGPQAGAGTSADGRLEIVDQVRARILLMNQQGGGQAKINLPDQVHGTASLGIQVEGNEVSLKMLSPGHQLQTILGQDLSILRESLGQQKLILGEVDLDFSRQDQSFENMARHQQSGSQEEHQTPWLSSSTKPLYTSPTLNQGDRNPLLPVPASASLASQYIQIQV